MSEGYLPPVVVQVTGDIRDLLAKLEEAKTALVDFSKTVSTAQLSADYSLVTKAITSAEAEMKAFASQDAQARLGVNTSTIPPAIAKVNAELAAWGREDANARAGLSTSAVTADITKINAELAAWGKRDANAQAGLNTGTVAPKLATIDAALAAWGKRDANATAGLNQGTVPAVLTAINAELAKWGKTHAEATAGLNQGPFDAGLTAAAGKLSAWASKPADKHVVFTSSAIPEPDWMVHPRIVWGNIPEPSWLAHPHVTETITGTEPSWWSKRGTVDLDANTLQLKAALTSAQAQLTALTAKVKTVKIGGEVQASLLASIAAAQAAIQTLPKQATIHVGADTTAAQAKLAQLKAEYDALVADLQAEQDLLRVRYPGSDIPVEPADVKRLAALEAEISATEQWIDGQKADIQVGADTSGALEKVAALKIAIDALSTSLVGDTGGGGGGKGGLAGALAAAGWGGGLFGLASIGSLAGLSGFGGERLITTLAGILGFTAAGGLGGGLLGLTSLGVAGTGMATDLAGIGQAAGDIKNMYTATSNLQAAIAQYGANSAQAKAAQYAYNQQLQSFPAVARKSVIGAVAAVQGFIKAFDSATGPAENIGAQIITQVIKGAEPLLPEIGSAALANMKIIQKALGPFLAWLDSAKPGGGLADLTQIENVFTRNLPTAMQALTKGFQALADVITYLAPQTGKLTAWIAKFFTSLTTPSGLSATAKTHINKWIDDWHVLTAFFKSIVKAIEAISAASAGTGKSIFTTLTSMIDQFTKWAKTTVGNKELNTLMTAHKNQLDAFLRLLGALVGAFAKLELAVSPTLVNGLTAVVKGLTALMNSKITIGSGIKDFVKDLTGIGNTKIDIKGLDPLKLVGGFVSGLVSLVKAIPRLTLGELTATAGGILLLATRISLLKGALSAIVGVLTGKVHSISDFWKVLTGSSGKTQTTAANTMLDAARIMMDAARTMTGAGAEEEVAGAEELGAGPGGLLGKIVGFLGKGGILSSLGLLAVGGLTIAGIAKLLDVAMGGNLHLPPVGGRGRGGVGGLSPNQPVTMPGGVTGVAPPTNLGLTGQQMQQLLGAGGQSLTLAQLEAGGKQMAAAVVEMIKEAQLKHKKAPFTTAVGLEAMKLTGLFGKVKIDNTSLAQLIKDMQADGVKVGQKMVAGIEQGVTSSTGLAAMSMGVADKSLNALMLSTAKFKAVGMTWGEALAAGITAERSLAARALAGITTFGHPTTGTSTGGSISIHTTNQFHMMGTPDMNRGSTFSKELGKALDEHDRKLIQAIRAGRM